MGVELQKNKNKNKNKNKKKKNKNKNNNNNNKLYHIQNSTHMEGAAFGDPREKMVIGGISEGFRYMCLLMSGVMRVTNSFSIHVKRSSD